MNDPDLEQAENWAKKLLLKNDWVVLDTETTGLRDAEIVQVAIVNPDGTTLLDSLVKPTIPIPTDAEAIHSISDEKVEFAPTFPKIYPIISEAIKGKTVVIYNASFDASILNYCCELHNLPRLWVVNQYVCAMHWYSQWVGDWNDYYKSYRWQKLPGGDHTALGDCLATLKVIKRMAGEEVEIEGRSGIPF